MEEELNLLRQQLQAEQKKRVDLERELALSNKIIEQLENAVIITDTEGKVLFVNEAFETITGYRRQDVLGINPQILKSGKHGPEFYEELLNIFQDQKAFRFIFTDKTRKGDIIHIDETIIPVMDDSQNIIQFVSLWKDVTARQTEEKKLMQDFRQLKKQNANKDKFLSILSHDLRAPFNGLLGYSELLEGQLESLSPEDIQMCASRINSSARQALDMLQDVLQWGKLQAGSIKYQPALTRLDMAVKGVFVILADNAAQKNIDLLNTVDETIKVFADPNMLNLMLRNLVTNGIKFTKPGGSVTVAAKDIEDQIRLTVTDTGVGIRAEHLNSLFLIEKKFSTAGTAGEKGSGLGLVLCRDLALKNGGTVEVQSELGKGSTFTLNLLKSHKDS